MRTLVYVPFLAAALLLGWHYLTPESQPTEVSVQSTPNVVAQRETTAPLAAIRTDIPVTPATIESHLGTQVDGMLEVDRNGSLLITEQIRHLFDYFYTTVGEVSFEQASANIRQHLTARLPQPALDQALAILDDYIEYKTALVELEQAFPVAGDIDALRGRADAVQRLRARIFSPETHQAFFAAEEVFNSFTLERLAIMHDDNITRQDKAAMIEDLRQSLPEDMQDLLVPQIHQVLTEQTDMLQSAGADASEIRALRMSMVGPEATGRLETLDQQRQQWQRRLDEFSAERQAIADHPGLGDADKQQAINALVTQRFAPNEQLRIGSLLDDRLDKP
jgi:lipase chaperone LimK